MKIYLFLAFICFLSCASEKQDLDSIHEKLEAYITPTLQDAASYEFVEITGLDTITHKEYNEQIIDMQKLNLLNAKDRLSAMDRAEASARKLLASNPKDTVTMLNILEIDYSRNELIKQLQNVDSLTTTLSLPHINDIKFLQLYYTFKANNAQGQKVLFRYYVKLNEDLSVLTASLIRE